MTPSNELFDKWQDLLNNAKTRQEWINYYCENDPVLNAVLDFCKQKSGSTIYIQKSGSTIYNIPVLELAMIAILDAKSSTITHSLIDDYDN